MKDGITIKNNRTCKLAIFSKFLTLKSYCETKRIRSGKICLSKDATTFFDLKMFWSSQLVNCPQNKKNERTNFCIFD